MDTQSTPKSRLQSRTQMSKPAQIGTDGILAGVIGAATLALWFLVVDLIDGEPLYTPTILSKLFLRMEGASPEFHTLQSPFQIVWGYTWLHGLVFVGLGGLISWLLGATERNPDIGFGVLLFITLLGVLVTGVVAVYATQVLRVLGWPEIFIGNLLAAAAMLVYFWCRHRHLRISN